jgi:hypothetical protein
LASRKSKLKKNQHEHENDRLSKGAASAAPQSILQDPGLAPASPLVGAKTIFEQSLACDH